MKIIKAGYEVLTNVSGYEILQRIEKIARTCYKSEDRITTESAIAFVNMLINRGHEAMLEHESISVKFIVDRGVSHELVRHRLASFAQESTRYCNYSTDKFDNHLTFIAPLWWIEGSQEFGIWKESMRFAEEGYFLLIDSGARAEQARSVLPNSLKTEIVVTANLREWRHILKLRTAKAAHSQMREVMIPLLAHFKIIVPVIFDDMVADEVTK